MVIPPPRPATIPQADRSMKPLCKWQITFSKMVKSAEMSVQLPSLVEVMIKGGSHIIESQSSSLNCSMLPEDEI
jgi:hypothetical protein